MVVNAKCMYINNHGRTKIAYYYFNQRMAEAKASYSNYNIKVVLILTLGSLSFGYANAVQRLVCSRFTIVLSI